MSEPRFLEDSLPGGGAFVVDGSPTSPYPHSGTCARCLRERNDLFWHEQDSTYYCVDVLRCEARYHVQCEREAAA